MSRKLTKHEEDVLFSDFPDSGEEYDRETVNKYSKNTRGSVRLATGRFYTPKEMKDRTKKAFSIKF